MPRKQSQKNGQPSRDIVAGKVSRGPGIDVSLYSLEGYKRWLLRLQRAQQPKN